MCDHRSRFLFAAPLALAALAPPCAGQAALGPEQFALFPRLQFPRDVLVCRSSWDVAVADFDGDGDPDVFQSPRPSQASLALFVNDGRSRFTEVTPSHLPVLPDEVWDSAVGDIDGDGDLDIALGRQHGSSLRPFLPNLLVNDGTGRFTDETTLRITDPNAFDFNDDVLLVDVDADGDLDLIRSGSRTFLQTHSTHLFANDGNGFFVLVPDAFPPDGSANASLGGTLCSADLDSDGDPDFVAGSRGGMVLWLNDGTGRFTEHGQTHFPSWANGSLDVELADVDLDGDLDVASSRAFLGREPQLYLNDGSAHFTDVTATHVSPVPWPVLDFAFGDIDEDGDPDLVGQKPFEINRWPGRDVAWLNDGTGHFTEHSASVFPPMPNGGAQDVELADFDGDGDLDVVLTDLGGGPNPVCYTRVLTNRLRQIHAPAEPVLGQPWTVEVHGPPGGGAALAFGNAAASIPLGPLGTFGIDPATTALWPLPLLLDADRFASIRLPIPNAPALLGAPIFAQALVVDPGDGRLRLTHTLAERIR